jgi:hypothetical protein
LSGAFESSGRRFHQYSCGCERVQDLSEVEENGRGRRKSVLGIADQLAAAAGEFRGDAAFARPEVYEALEERGVKYAIRIPANDSLERDIAELLPRPVGRPSRKPLVE